MNHRKTNIMEKNYPPPYFTNILFSKIKQIAIGFYRYYATYASSAYEFIGYIKSDEERDRLLANPKFEDPGRLEKYGYKVYSQNDEDGIIAEIFKRIGTTSKFFIEFGVEKGIENNTLFLLLQGWEGVWLEGSNKYVSAIRKKFTHYINDKKLTVKNAMITRDNINQLLVETGCDKQSIDLLSVDIDGNDYHVFAAITVINPRVVVIEYNAKFPPPMRWIMKYNPEHIWDGSDMHGMSLQSLEELAQEKNYQLVGTNLTGTNAFLVRSDLVSSLFPSQSTAENLYNPPRYYLRFSCGHGVKETPVNDIISLSR